jgi:flagellar hook assembly protein FlgD
VQLHQNYPNPFNPETRIDFEIPKTEKVKLVIYNTLGKEVKTLLDDELQDGKYSTTWNGKDDMNNKVSSGIYFYHLTFGNNMQSITKKLIIIK